MTEPERSQCQLRIAMAIKQTLHRRKLSVVEAKNSISSRLHAALFADVADSRNEDMLTTRH